MTDNEKAAREIVDKSIKLHICVSEARNVFGARSKGTGALRDLVLTDQECENIAANYPITYHKIRIVFDEEI